MTLRRKPAWPMCLNTVGFCRLKKALPAYGHFKIRYGLQSECEYRLRRNHLYERLSIDRNRATTAPQFSIDHGSHQRRHGRTLATELEVVRNEISANRKRQHSRLASGLWQNIRLATVTPTLNPWQGPHHRSKHPTRQGRNVGQEHYKPEKATIMVVGDFDTSDPRDLLSMLYENLDPQMFHPALTEELLAYAPREGIEEPQQDNPDHWWLWPWTPTNLSRC